MRALMFETPGGGIFAIRKDAVVSVCATAYVSRNLGCTVNGNDVCAGFDSVVAALGWTIDDEGEQ